MREYEIIYSGPGVSLNKWYASNHWKKRHQAKNKYKEIFSGLFLEAGMHLGPQMNCFSVHLEYRSTMDVDNTIAMVKIAVDTMKGMCVPEDNRNHFKRVTLEYNPQLKHNTYIFRIRELDGN